MSSIRECIESTKLTEEQIRKTKALPDLWSMCRDCGLSEKFYIGTQRMGSHEVHGTWTSLSSHYLRQDKNGEYHLRDHNVRPHENQFMVIPMVILETLKRFIEYVVPTPIHRKPIASIITETKTELEKLTQEIVSPDFEFKS